MKETYIIKIWETEEERDAGLSEIISSNIADLKTAIQDAKKLKEEQNNKRIASPYTRQAPLKDNKTFAISIIIIVILVVLAIIWSIKQVTNGSVGTNIINFFSK